MLTTASGAPLATRAQFPFRDYNCVLLEEACATSSPDHCTQWVVFNAKQCWGFSTTTDKLAEPQPVG